MISNPSLDAALPARRLDVRTGVEEERDLSEAAETWLLIESDDVPEQWSHRSMRITVIRLAPDEAKRVLSNDHASPIIGPEHEELAHLVASGLSVSQMSQQLHLTSRSVYRRLARLRNVFGVATLNELATKLSRLGY
jgi:DNA-binding NarL/FixJ family response regulator